MPLPFDVADLQYQPFSEECPRGAFSCGNETIDGWFRKKADKHHLNRCRLTTVHAPGDLNPVAFYALGSAVSRLNTKVLPVYFGKDYFPSLRLEWLGVRTDLQGSGLGIVIMGRVLADFADIISRAHIPAMTLVPADDRAARFYRKMGFVDLHKVIGPEMVLPATDVIDTIIRPQLAPK